jgi:predicted alpha/beta-hydrolase family hydrolase
VTEVIEVATDQGTARLHIDPARRARAVLVVGHGAGGGVEAADLVALADSLPVWGVTVVRMEQPWRVAGRRVAVPPPRLDQAWLATAAAWPTLPLVVGGRSAGARVACRTATRVGAVGVVALAFPLHPPGRPDRSRASELLGDVPTLVVQGERDPFGGPSELPRTRAVTVAGIPAADHSLALPRTGPITRREGLEMLEVAVRRFVCGLLT